MQVPVSKIGLVIGPGGRMIQGIRDDTGCSDISVRSPSTLLLCQSYVSYLGHTSLQGEYSADAITATAHQMDLRTLIKCHALY